ncbi:MAG: UDP-N-acetylmuramoyl-L-alanine--D-glutamate ligase [Ignavibacteria bacterium]|nr:UDP-N-acetylmuramoyl-L-alanine--D-glutamate ligase [Ignavibacteria bacterium]
MININNSSFTILGAGRSGIAVARLLKKNGGKVFLSDGSKRESLKYLDEEVLKNEGIEFETGNHTDRIFENDIIIKSPGIPPDNEYISGAKKLGKKIYSEIEAAYWLCKGRIIAITGTNGKTTTTVLTGEIFRNAGYDTKVCGNVGLAFSEIAESVKEDSVVILETSSYQLYDTEEFRPEISVLMNITPDHLEWHKGFENYLDSKLKIMKNQTEKETAVINYDDEILRKSTTGFNTKKAYFSIKENLFGKKDVNSGSCIENDKVIYFDKSKNLKEEIMNAGEINIRGNHNIYNSLAAVISARAFQIKKEIIIETLKTFKGVEHRIEFVREFGGVKYFNDSKATNTDSLTVALESFIDGNLILIMGGREKDNDYSSLVKLIKERVKIIIAIGESRNKINDFFSVNTKVIKAETMQDAVNEAKNSAEPGDTVLLSPACKSFDMYDSFEHRGRDFKNIVNQLN